MQKFDKEYNEMFYDIMVPPKTVRIVSGKLKLDHTCHPYATDGEITLGWYELQCLYCTGFFEPIEVLPSKESLYFYNNEGSQEYIKEWCWVNFDWRLINANEDGRFEFAKEYYPSDEDAETNLLKTYKSKIPKGYEHEVEYMYYKPSHGPKDIRIVSNILQLDIFIEQEECHPNISFDDLDVLEKSLLFDKLLFCCERTIYGLADWDPERYFDWNDRWWDRKMCHMKRKSID